MQVSSGGLKNMDVKNQISTKSERFTARTGFDLFPSTLLYDEEETIYIYIWHILGFLQPKPSALRRLRYEPPFFTAPMQCSPL